MRRYSFATAVAILSLLVGVLHVVPPLAIARHLAAAGMPFVFAFESYRNDLAYLTWAREIYDGHFPPRDPFSDPASARPMIQNPLPASILAGFLALTGGNAVRAYLWALFAFSQVNFLVFFWLGRRLFGSRVWALSFALIAALTPIALRILNFDGTA